MFFIDKHTFVVFQKESFCEMEFTLYAKPINRQQFASTFHRASKKVRPFK